MYPIFVYLKCMIVFLRTNVISHQRQHRNTIGLLRPRPARVLPVLLTHGPGEDVDAVSQPCRALLLRTGRVRFPVLWWGSDRGGVCGPVSGLRRRFAAGRSALGQVTVRWGRLFTCPDVGCPAPMSGFLPWCGSPGSVSTVILRSASVIPLAK